ncbi:hypothetical protein CSV79_16070 [Sporosarcina sp. P13]|uniref:hypothetical protein n=1 Tax=Sporosarcina sp. P13 TaxID=2048263 RepID=UPI000C172C99|nr:hypothetical protein [Sporosarcina sp. P13]PIC62623.1 hypothetical protein CSV79_16070 [Sporosarcina sp. P13]
MNDETLRSAFESWEALSGTPEEFFAYESRWKRVIDEEAAIREAELRLEEAVQEAVQEAAFKTKKQMARNLLDMGMEVEKIAEATELDKQLVLDIQTEMRHR